MIEYILEDLWAISALINTAAGVGVTCMAIGVTQGWRFRTRLDVVRTLHRLSLGGLAVALFMNAGLTYDTEVDPRTEDFVVQVAFFCAILFSGIRHRMVVRVAAGSPAAT